MPLLKIVPEKSVDGYPTRCNGVKCLVGDELLKGVTRIELVAVPGGVWQAKIVCNVQVDGMINAQLAGEENGN